MAKASQFTTTGTIDPALDMIPYMKWNGIKFVNRKVTAVNAGIQQPDYVAQAQATAARAQANEASDIADTALTTAWFGTSAGKSASGIATASLTTAWSGTAIGRQAQADATAALSTAWTGTSTAHEAYEVARAALDTAWTGTDAPTAQAEAAMKVATAALTTAWVGTAAGNVAYDLATYAISLTGTAVVVDLSAVYNVAWYGTSSAKEAAAVATAALTTAWVGTSIGQEAYSISNTALTTAWNGTVLANTAYGLATYAIGLTGTASSGGGGADLATAWAGTAAAREARAVAQTALDTAWVGTSSAREAYVVALTAMTTSWTGTSTARQSQEVAQTALETSWTGTSTGHEAYDVALTAMTTSWTGTSTGHEAYDVAKTALETAWAGTTLATSAHSVASSAYNVAVSGTVGSVTVAVASGTAVLNMDGQVYQTVYITGDTALTVTNQKPITPTKVQEITAVLRGDGVAHNVTCDNFNWMTDAVTTIGVNKEIFLGLTSFGSLVSQVYASALIEDTRFLSMNANSLAAIAMSRTALDTSWAGTALGRSALDTSWAGTSLGHEAYDLARAAYALATAGTASHSTLSASAGTVVFSMSGSAYQSAVIGGDTAIAVANIQAPTSTHIQAITARIHNNNSGNDFTLFWDAFGVIGATPPSTVTDNHSVFASFTSYGTNVQNVFLTTASHI